MSRIRWFHILVVLWSVSLDSNALGGSLKRIDDAQKYFIEGKMTVDEGDLKEAIPFFRAALRLVPESEEYLLMLGTSEYQLGFYEKAKKRFEKVLLINPHSMTAKYYTKLAKSRLKKSLICFNGECDDEEAKYIVYSAIPDLNTQLLQLCTDNADQSHFCFPNFSDHNHEPFVIRGALQYMGYNASIFMLDSLNSSYGTELVDFYPQNMLTKPSKVYTVPFHQALQYLSYPEGAYLSVDTSEQGTYIQWNMNETTWNSILQNAQLLQSFPKFLSHSMDSLFSDSNRKNQSLQWENLSVEEKNRIKHEFGRKTHWYMLLVGEEGAGMFGHQDTLPVGSWQAQVVGSKRWQLCSPESTAMVPDSERLDMDSSTADASGGGRDGVCYETVLHPGDLIYYPPYYWHTTLNLESPTVALSGTVVLDSIASQELSSNEYVGIAGQDGTTSSTGSTTSGSIPYRVELIEFLKEECRENRKGFSFSPELCAIL